MAIEIQGFKIPATAGMTLTSAQYRCVQFNANMQVVTGTSACIPCGILQNDPYNGGGAEIMVSGLTKVVQAASLAATTIIKCNDLVSSVAAISSGTYGIGQMALNSGASGAIGSALISCYCPAYRT